MFEYITTGDFGELLNSGLMRSITWIRTTSIWKNLDSNLDGHTAFLYQKKIPSVPSGLRPRSNLRPRTAKFDPSRLWAKYASFPLYPLLWVRFSSRSDSNVVCTAQGGDFNPKYQWHEYDMNNFWIIIPTLPCAIPLPTTCIRCFNTFCSVSSHSRPETLDKRWQDYIEFWNCKIGGNMFEQNWTELQQAPIHKVPCKAFRTGTSRDDSISFHSFQISKSVVLKTWNWE